MKKYDPVVIAITGSVGKTSTKEAVSLVLSDAFGEKEVRKNYGNLNAEIGIPLTILGYRSLPNKFLWPFFLVSAFFRTRVTSYPKYLVIEMGVEHPGDIKYFASIVRPDFAVITSAEPAHLANFSGHEAFQKEKASLARMTKENGKVILNYDDKYLSELDGENIISYAIDNSRAKYTGDSIKITTEGTEFRINCVGHKIAIKSRLLGRQLIYGQLAAFAIAGEMDISLLSTGKSLEKLLPVPGRMNIVEGKDEVTIIDDTYNSNPSSAKAALSALSEVRYDGRKVAILGNMNELGRLEKDAHQELGKYAKDKCDLAVFVGKNAKTMAEGYSDKKTSLVFANKLDLIQNLPSIIMKNDLVLIKASQNGNYFEEITKILMKHPGEAEKLLVRQGWEWRKKKNK